MIQQLPYRCTKEDGLTLNHQKQDLVSYDLSKKVINLLRHNQTLQREDDGAIEFYKIKFYLRNHHSQIQVWSDDRWKACLAAGGGSKKDISIALMIREEFSTSVLFKDILEAISLILRYRTMWVIGTGIFHYIYPHRMCIQSSFYYQQWIDTWMSRFEKKTDSILLAH